MQPGTTQEFSGPDPVWEQPGWPFRLQFSGNSLENIRLASVRGMMALPRFGMGVGGLILGYRTGETIRVVGLEEIPCSHAYGPSFALTPDEVVNAAHQVETRAAGSVVGWYLSRVRGGLELHQRDLDLTNEICPAEWQFALVIRPGGGEPAQAALHYRDATGALIKGTERRIYEPTLIAQQEEESPAEAMRRILRQAEAPSSAVSSQDFGYHPATFGSLVIKEPPPVAPKEPVAAAPAPEPEPEPVAAPVVLEEAVPEQPLVEALPESAPVMEATEEPAAEVPVELVSEPVAESEAPAVEPVAPKKKKKKAAPKKPADPDLLVGRPQLVTEPQPYVQPRLNIDWKRWIGATVVVVLIMIVWSTRSLWLPKTPLVLDVADANGKIAVHWNREAVMSADNGNLLLEEGGDIRQSIDLTQDQLRYGTWVAERHSPKVTVTLTAGDVHSSVIYYAPTKPTPAPKPASGIPGGPPGAPAPASAPPPAAAAPKK